MPARSSRDSREREQRRNEGRWIEQAHALALHPTTREGGVSRRSDLLNGEEKGKVGLENPQEKVKGRVGENVRKGRTGGERERDSVLSASTGGWVIPANRRSWFTVSLVQ